MESGDESKAETSAFLEPVAAQVSVEEKVVQPAPTLYSGRLFTHVLSLVSGAWDTRKGWLEEFFDTSELGLPSFSGLSRRVSLNAGYFRSNYILVATGCVLVSVLNAALGFIIALGFLYLIDKHAAKTSSRNQGGRSTDKQRLVYVLLILLVLGVTDITEELLRAALWAAGFVSVHAVFHVAKEEQISRANGRSNNMETVTEGEEAA